MSLDRRSLLKGLAVTGVAAIAVEPAAEARVRKTPPPDAVGLFYDTTLCIGCKSCVVACREANGLTPDTDYFPGRLYQAPTDLNGQTKNVIKLYKDGATLSYVKMQCMHCVDPACATACMIGALAKREHGIVTYDAAKCIGCRYCQVACPFNVPKFEWKESLTPKIVKCEMCKERLAKGQEPACVAVCPRKAVIYGGREALLAEARKRLKDHPDRYVPKIYGETDAGGTQCLYISHVPFEKLGLPNIGDEPVPEMQQAIQHGIYQGFIAPLALYGLLGAVMFRNRKKAAGEKTDETGGPS